MEILSAKGIYKKYGKDIILNNLFFSVDAQDFVAIMGRSGSGKTTLLNILGLLDQYESGEIHYQGKRLNFNHQKEIARIRKENLAFIVQDFALVYELNVFENIELPLLSLRMSRNKRKQKVYEIAKIMGITHLLEKYPDKLSGGECQKVAICRAIIKNPKILLADEPTGSLDKKSEEQIMDLLRWLNSRGMTIILVTHSMTVAEKCNKIYDIDSLQKLSNDFNVTEGDS